MANRFSVEAIFKAIDRFTAPVTAMQARVGKFTQAATANFKSVNRAINTAASSLVKFGKAALKWGAIGLTALGGATLGVVREFSRIENARAAFTPLLGSVDRAKQLVGDLNALMVETPFEFDALTDAAKTLLPTMNGDIAKTVDTIRMLGDTAGGNAQKLESITRGFTKAMLKGKVDLEALNMIAEAGVPIFTELAKSMGREVNPQFFKMISAGKITTAELTKAFQKMTSEGGIFFNGMKIASVTTSALWSGFMDNVRSTAAVIGEELDPYVKELIGYLTSVTQRLREWVLQNREFIQTKIAQYVADIKKNFDAFLNSLSNAKSAGGWLDTLLNVLTTIADIILWLGRHADTIGKLVKWVVVLTLVFKAFAAIMTIVNLVMLANPFGLIVVAIGLVIAALAALWIWFDDIKAWFNDLPGWAQAPFYILTSGFQLLIGLAELCIKAWDMFGEDIKNIWRSIGDFIMGIFDKIKPIMSAVTGFHSGLVNMGAKFWTNVLGLEEKQDSAPPPVVGPEARAARTIEESRSTSTAELFIHDATGKAEMKKRGEAPGISFSMVPTGAF